MSGVSGVSGEFESQLNGLGAEYLTISVGDTVLELLPMGDLPAKKVMEMMAKPQSEKLAASLELMKLAARNPVEFERESEFISFNELITALDVWMDKSSDYANKVRSKLVRKDRTSSSGSRGFSKKRKSEARKIVDEIVAELGLDGGESGSESEVSEEEKEFLEYVTMAVTESRLREEATEEEIVVAICVWFVRNGKEDMMVQRKLMTARSRSGKYYPIINDKIARRLGFENEQH